MLPCHADGHAIRYATPAAIAPRALAAAADSLLPAKAVISMMPPLRYLLPILC